MTFQKRDTAAIEAISQVRQTMDQSQLDIADTMAKVNAQHISTFRNGALERHVDRLKRSLVAHYTGDDKQHRILFIIGESHSGKTTLVEHVLRTDPAFQPYITTDGIEAMPCLHLPAPSPCTLHNIASDGLEKLGYPIKSTLTESRIWPLFREQLKRRRVIFLFIDEAQHAIKSNNSSWEIQKVRDTFKHLVQMPEWPVRLILCGVSPLELLRDGDKQIASRSTVLNLGPLTEDKHGPHVRRYVELVVQEHADLALGDFLRGDFPKRIIHACGGCFGSIVQLIRYAVETALLAGEGKVLPEHFARAYADISGCSPSSNIFTIKSWRTMEPGEARITEEPYGDSDGGGDDGGQKPKRLRAGERRH
ncbi:MULTISPECIES: ATP-binding protein [Rhizobium]|uniref:ATP-binding protein n=1 Tax=Rhizobium TaxID=379 RepID=UPI0013F147FB|nr:ATP-binding protein [Rhizobium leguminosarum]